MTNTRTRSPRVLPEAFESISIRRIRGDHPAVAAAMGYDCDICGRPAHWQIVSKWRTEAEPQWLTAHLCPVDGWEFVSALGDNLRAGDP